MWLFRIILLITFFGMLQTLLETKKVSKLTYHHKMEVYLTEGELDDEGEEETARRPSLQVSAVTLKTNQAL